MWKLYTDIVRRVCFITLILLVCPLAAAQDDAQLNQSNRPKIGLVLSGGGARGTAHIGVLKVLEENHIPIDMISGTSFGSIVGGLYAAGYSADDLQDILENIDWKESLSGRAPREERSFRRKQDDNGFLIRFKLGIKDGKLKLPGGLITPNNLRLTLQDLINERTNVEDFDELPIPFRAVATDLGTGNAFVLEEGNLASAMIASMAIPALFPPIEYDGHLLVDGGVTNNVPVDVVRSMGADIVIVVDISTPMMSTDEIKSFTNVIDQLVLMMTSKNAAAQLATLTDQDILIRPELDDIGFVDFERSMEAIPRGETATQMALPKLHAFSLSQPAWIAHLNARNTGKKQQPVIDFIHIVNDSKISDEVIRARLSLKPGQRFDEVSMSDDLSEIFGLELFEEVSYRIIEEDDQTGVEVLAKRSESGHKYFRFGLAIQDDFNGESDYRISAAFTNLAVNKIGGEIEARIALGDEQGVFAEFYQPVDAAQRYYLFANAGYGTTNTNIFDDDRILAQARISETRGQIGAGINFGNWGTLYGALQRSTGKVKDRIGLPADTSIPFDDTAFVTEFLIDTLDNVKFPHRGMLVTATYVNSTSWLGGDNDIDTLQIGGYHPVTWGRNTLGFIYRFATVNNELPSDRGLFQLGGFTNMTAYQPGQLSGNHGGTLGAMYYYRLGGIRMLTQTSFYVGGVLEAGNGWNQRSDMSFHDLHTSASIFIGADTFLGPIYLGYGVGDDGNSAAFLYIGQLF
jgi:NTE family protein